MIMKTLPDLPFHPTLDIYVPGGASIRETFAMAAMQGLLSGDREPYLVNGGYLSFDLLAADSVLQADALVKALNKYK